MAHLVAAFGVPHTPMFPHWVEQEGDQSETAQLFQEVARHLDQVGADVLLIFDSDHLNTFFLNNLPTFCVGVAPATQGPNEVVPAVARARVPVHEALGCHLYHQGVLQGFDLAVSQEFEIDHSIMVPLHFLTPQMQTPIVPIFINGIVPPLPSAQRCYRLGQTLQAALDSLDNGLNVAVLASGSFSLEVGGPQMGWTDQAWMDTVLDCLEHGRVEELLNLATTERMLAAGNVSGELLNWIALLGAVGHRRPVFLAPQRHFGHGYGVWRWD